MTDSEKTVLLMLVESQGERIKTLEDKLIQMRSENLAILGKFTRALTMMSEYAGQHRESLQRDAARLDDALSRESGKKVM